MFSLVANTPSSSCSFHFSTCSAVSKEMCPEETKKEEDKEREEEKGREDEKTKRRMYIDIKEENKRRFSKSNGEGTKQSVAHVRLASG